jgi:hypothetical protein
MVMRAIEQQRASAAVLDTATWQRVEWLGLACRVPASWEIVRHSRALAAGRLVFVDRRRERFVLSWASCRAAPDLERLVADFVAARGGPAERIRHGRWRGISQREPSGEQRIQVVLYDAESARLLEAQLHVPAPSAEPEFVSRVLESLAVSEPAAACRRWRAFGLAVCTPPGVALVSAEVLPSEARFCFTRSGSALVSEAEVRRLALARSWFDGDLRALLEQRLGRTALERYERRTYGGRAALYGEGAEAVLRLQRWLGRGRRRRALAFVVPEDNAAYLVTTLSPSAEPLEPQAFEVGSAREGE